MTLGKRINAARKRLRPKLTQAALGERFGITVQAVSAWERDDTRPEPEKFVALAKELKVPLEWLMAGEGAVPPASDLSVQIQDLTPAQRQAVSAYIHVLLKGVGEAA